MGYVGTAPLSGDYRKLDDVSSGFNGSATGFTLQVGSVNVTPPKETTLLISVGGILQEPISAYTVSGSTITFTAAPATGADFFGVMLGDALSIGTPANDTVTGAKIVDNAIDSEHYTDASIDFAHIQNVAANSVLGRNANSSGVLSEVALATTQILIGDGTGFTAAALSGDATMTNAGVVSIASGVLIDADVKSDAAIAISKTALVAGTGITLATNTLNVDAAQSQITTVGALNAGSITSGFTSIDVGSGGITTTGAIAGGTIDASTDFTVGGTVITDGALADGAFTFNSDVFVANAKGLVIGHTAQVASGASFELQVLGTAQADSGVLIGRWSADTGGPELAFVNSRSGTIGGSAVLVNGDPIGTIYFRANDGTDHHTLGAYIQASVDGTPGVNDLPTKFTFATTADGASSSTEALRIDSNQDTSIPLGSKFAFDTGVGDTYIYQESADDLHIVVGGAIYQQFDQDLDSVGFGSSAPPSGTIHRYWAHSFTATTGATGYMNLHSGTLTGTTGRTSGLVNHLFQDQVVTQTATEDIAVISQLSIREPRIADNLTGDIAIAASLYVIDAPTEATTNAAIYVAGGDVIIGSGSTAAANSYSKLVIAEDDYARIELINPADRAGSLWFSDATEGMGRLEYSHSSDAMQFRTNQALRMTLDSVGTAFIGTDSANTNMTIGLTINQAANSNQILAFKADITTGLTTVAGAMETDDFYTIRQASSLGGIWQHVLADDGALADVWKVGVYGGTADTTKSTSGKGLISFETYEHNGANAVADITANGNVFSIRARVSSSTRTVFMVDEDGDLFADAGTTTNAVTVFDEEDDVSLVRAFDIARADNGTKGIIVDEWDKYAHRNESDLVRHGILGDTIANGGLVNVTRLQQLHNGAIWQQQKQHMSLADEVESLRGRLASAEQQLQALEAH